MAKDPPATRRELRHPRRLSLELEDSRGVKTRGVTTNISLGGMFVETAAVYPYGTRLRLRIELPGRSTPIEVAGDVRWSDVASEVQRGLGIHFGGLKAKDVWELNRYLSSQGPDGSDPPEGDPDP
jgi:uncharacterized protein (TIGR02266 family)